MGTFNELVEGIVNNLYLYYKSKKTKKKSNKQFFWCRYDCGNFVLVRSHQTINLFISFFGLS